MNRRVVILSFVYDSFANFSARWYMISSMVGVSFSHGKSVQKRCIFGSGLFKAMETARPISCWTSSFVMMSDMRAGRINCIVVKDLSRLGRDYIETGNLVERVFPMMNIRFVAITDNYDSSKKDADLMVAVTNIANDLYAKDISKKISSSKQEAMEKGIPVGRVTYGYKVVLDENKVRVMVEDKERIVVTACL